MKLPEMKTGLTISARGARRPAAVGADFVRRRARSRPRPTTSLPVDIISDKQFSEMTAGVKNAPQGRSRKAAGREDRRDRSRSRTSTAEGRGQAGGRSRAADAAAAAEPEPKQAEAKPEKKKEPPKVDPIAEALKKEEAEEEARRGEAEGRRPSRRSRSSSSSRSSTRRRSRRCSTSATRSARPRPARRVSQTPSLGMSHGSAGQAVAERDRRAARAAQRMLESAGRRRQCAEPEGRDCASCSSATARSHAGRRWSRAPASPFGPAMARKRHARGPELPAVQDAAARDTTSSGRTSRSPSTRATCSAADELDYRNHALDSHDGPTELPALLDRRRAAGWRCRGGARCWPAAAPARAQSRIDVTQGNVQPMPIALPDFVGGTPDDGEIGAQRHAGHHRQPAALRACSRRSIRRPTSRRSPTSTRCRAFPTGAPSTRRRWSPAASRGRATAGSRPSSGCGTCSPAQQLDRPAVLHRAGQLAPHRAHHLRRDLRAADRREGLFRQPRRVRRRDRARRTAASSGSPSWTRTAPTCAISRAATISC